MSAAAHSLEAGSSFAKKESASVTRRLFFAKLKKARQARGGNRGHMSAATHSLESGSNFPANKKARQARIGHRGHMLAATHSLEAGSNFLSHKKNRFCGLFF
ncbi:MAG: hypothetical protein FWF77_08705 [Defluviitaleaceae bacterium]|nr:hypothetical protein [Defluviitaleaceae bacterium]